MLGGGDNVLSEPSLGRELRFLRTGMVETDSRGLHIAERRKSKPSGMGASGEARIPMWWNTTRVILCDWCTRTEEGGPCLAARWLSQIIGKWG